MALPVTITGLSNSAGLLTRPFLSSGGNVYVLGIDSTDSTKVRAFKATDPTSSFSNVGTDFTLTSGNTCQVIRAYQSSDTLHVVTSDGVAATSIDYRYHVFSMSSDSWTTTNEAIETGLSLVSLQSADHADISARSDGDIIVIYNGTPGASMGTDYERVKYARREATVWTTGVALDNAGATNWYASMSAQGASDRTHFILQDGNADDAYQRTLTSTNTLGTLAAFDSAIHATESNSRQIGASYVSGATTKVRFPIYDATASTVNSASFDSADSPTVTNESDITGATLANTTTAFKSSFVADGTTLWHTFIIGTDNDIYTQSNADGAGWSAPASFYSDASGAILTQQSTVYTRGSDVVIGIVYTISGAVKYHEKTLSSGGSAWSSAATATATFTGAGVASSSLSASALASVTWTGNGLYPAALNAAATATITWGGVEIAGATEADWSSAAAASVTWGGTGLYPAALSAAAAATVTFNGTATAASDWSSATATSVTFNGAAEADSAWSAAAIAALTFDTREIHNADWSSAAAASVTWDGAQLQLVSAAWSAAAAASLVATGASTAASDWAAAAAAALAMTGAATTASAWNAAATASLAAAGASLVDANWNSQAAATLTLNGTGLYPAAWSSQAAASLTWDGAEIAVTGSAWSAASAASVTWGGVTIASGYIDTDVDALATLRMVGGSIRAADWNSQATATFTYTGVTLLPAAWNAAATASLTMEGQAIGGAFTEAALSSDAAASLIAAGAATAAGALDSQAVASATFGGADATAPTGLSAIDRDGWRKERQRLDKLEELDEEDILFMLTAAINYMETCRVND